MHRIGGLEKEDGTGNVSYDPENHQKMVQIRQRKVDLVAEDIPEQSVDGPEKGDLLVLSWGGTFGACTTAVRQCREEGLSVAHAHLRYLNPFPRNLEAVLGNFRHILIPELNMGQLRTLIEAKYHLETIGLNKIKGKPFAVSEISRKIKEVLQAGA